MPYIEVYSIAWDLLYQCEIDEVTAKAALETGPCVISDMPIPGLRILSRFYSEWSHPVEKAPIYTIPTGEY